MINLQITYLITIIISLSSNSVYISLSLFLVFIFFYLNYAKCKNWLLSRDSAFFICNGIFIVLLMYSLLFSVADAKEYLLLNEEILSKTVTTGIFIAQSILYGSSLAIENVIISNKNFFPLKEKYDVFKTLVVIAWLPIFVNFISYAAFFSGKSYIDVHASSGSIGNILIKTIYITYAACILLNFYFHKDPRFEKSLIYILFGNLIIFVFLFQLRSPFFFFLLLFYYFSGYKIKVKYLAIFGFSAPIFLASVALWRDPTLLESGALIALANMFVTLGDFADTIPFTINHVNSNGISFGLDILGSLVGSSEPLANAYAKSISEEYFYSGGGFGFFLPADFIANFGELGAPVFGIFFGYFLSKMSSNTNSLAANTLAATFLASSFAFVRNDVGSTLRGCIYTLITVFILHLFIEILFRKNLFSNRIGKL